MAFIVIGSLPGPIAPADFTTDANFTNNPESARADNLIAERMNGERRVPMNSWSSNRIPQPLTTRHSKRLSTAWPQISQRSLTTTSPQVIDPFATGDEKLHFG